MARRKDSGTRIEVRSGENSYAADKAERLGMRAESRRVLLLGITCLLLVVGAMIAPTYIFEHSMMEFTPAVFMDVAA